MIKSESDSIINDPTGKKSTPENNASIWGSFSGSFFEPGGGSNPDPGETKPVLNQPRTHNSAKMANSSICNPLEVAVQSELSNIPSSQSQSSLMEGCTEEELLISQNEFSK